MECFWIHGSERPLSSKVFFFKFSNTHDHLWTQLIISIFRSTAQLTYDDCQKIIDGTEEEKEYNEQVKTDVRMLYSIAQCLHTSRYTKETMSLFKQHLVFDDPNQPTTATISHSRSDIVKIVKEFAFLANKCVAQKISSQYPEQALLRRQAPPNSRKIVRKYAFDNCEYMIY